MTFRPKIVTQAAKDAAMDFVSPDEDMGLAAHLAIDAKYRRPVSAPIQNAIAEGKALRAADIAARVAAQVHAPMAGELTEGTAIRRYIEGGHAIFTITSRKTGSRFTYQFSRPDLKGQPGAPRPIWARVLTGPDNTNDYTFAGTFWPSLTGDGYEYRRSAKVSLTDTAPSLVAVKWLLSNLDRPERLAQVEIHHEGRCCRCGRRLTVPSSIESGIGPECAKKM